MKRACFVCLSVAAVVAMFWLSQPPAGAQNGSWGTIKGQITWSGEPPTRNPLDLKDAKDAPHCLDKMGKPPLSEAWVVNPKNKGIRWTFVWLAPETGKTFTIHPDLQEIKEKEVVIDQPLCMFEPHALGIREGQVLIAKNSSSIAHSFKWTGNPFVNVGGNNTIPPGQQSPISNLKADKLPVIVECAIHPWMRGWVRVFNHPYYAVTDEDGNFEIKNAPAGKCNLMIWHASAGWRGGAAGKNGTPITIKTGDNTLGALPFNLK